MAPKTILIIDDEKDLIELVRYNLEKEGFQVKTSGDGENGLVAAAQVVPDLIVLDLMLPGIDGLEVCRALRSNPRTSRVPVIMLTARGAESDRVVGLEMGADDYVTKPFSPRELIARIRALLRRSGDRHPHLEVVRRGALVVDLSRREVTFRQTAIALTATEFKLLHVLASQPGRVFSRSELIDGVLGRDVAVQDRTIDVHVVSLRKKLGACGDQIQTVRGFGYRFNEE
jgi:two-component system, OmpR family, alkaline phosphatase synthesis response regulator PhoP